MEENQFHLFVSYARDPDRDLADDLAEFLEGFHEHVRLEAQEPESGQLQELRVCVDRSDFQPGKEKPEGGYAITVGEVIEEHLRASRILLVLCSRRSTASPWVEAEIRWWLANKPEGSETIRFAATEGEEPLSENHPFLPSIAKERGLHHHLHYDFRGFRQASAEWRDVGDYEMAQVQLAADLYGVSPGTLRPLWRRAQALRVAGLAQALVDRAPRNALLEAVRSLQFEESESGKSALRDAYFVLVEREENRRMMIERTGPGAIHFTGSWNRGQLVAQISATGQHTVIPSERGPDGPHPPGRVLLLDNYSLRSHEITDNEPNRRLECVAFDRTGKYLFVVRQFYWSVYNTSGQCLFRGAFNGTKAPVPIVVGYLGDRYLIAADTSGGVWLLDPETQESYTVHSEASNHQDMALSCDLANDGSAAFLRYGSGRGEFVRPPKNGVVPVVRLPEDCLSAAFVAGSPGEILTVGKAGIRRWKVADDEVRLELSIPCDPATIGDVWGSSGGAYVGTIDTEYIVTIYDSSGSEVEQIDRKDEIDWATAKAMPEGFLPVNRVDHAVGGRRYVTCSEGAFAIQAGDGGSERFIRLTGRSPAVRAIVAATGRTWIVTGAVIGKGGTAYWLHDYLAIPVPTYIGPVHEIMEQCGKTWLATDDGLWCWDEEGYRRTGVGNGVTRLVPVGDDLWAYRASYPHSPAWRVRNDSAVPVPHAVSKVEDVHIAADEIWLREGKFLYAVEGNTAKPRLDGLDMTTRIQVVGDQLWVLHQETAQRWTGSSWAEEPEPGVRVNSITNLDRGAWLVCVLARGESALYQAGSQVSRIMPLGSSTRIHAVRKIRGQVWIASGIGPYRLEDGALVRFSDRRLVARDVVDDGEDVWALGSCCVWRLRESGAECFRTGSWHPWMVWRVQEIVWVVTRKGFYDGPAYYVKGDEVSLYRTKGGEAPVVSRVDNIGGRAYLTTSKGGTPRLERAFSF